MKDKLKLKFNVKVAGSSLALRWLVDACQQAAPWSTIAPSSNNKSDEYEVKIDWQQALRQRGADDPTQLSAFLQDLLPVFPISMEDMRATYGQRHLNGRGKLPTAPLSFEKILISKEIGELLTCAGTALDSLSSMLIKRSHTYTYRFSTMLQTLQSARAAMKIRQISKTVMVKYHLEHRWQISQGKMVNIIKGGPDDKDYRPGTVGAGRRRAKSWRLVKRLIRAQVDFFNQLEFVLRMGIPKPQEQVPCLGADLLRALGQISEVERAAANSLTPAGFVILEDQFSYFAESNHESSADDSLDKELRSFKSQRDSHSPYGLLQSLLNDALATIRNNRNDFSPVEALKTAFNDAEEALQDAIRALALSHLPQSKSKTQIQMLHKTDIISAIDWAIAHSPLLTLLASGVLCLYRKKQCLGLSPWFMANIISEKILGRAPMTYLGVHAAIEGNEGTDSKNEEVTTTTKANVNVNVNANLKKINSRQLWELMQTTAI